jgi:CheY-like chemotaxis protein
LLDRSLREDVTVEIRLAPDLWRVEVDASQLEVAVLNIAINARDAMPDGGDIVIEGHNEPSGQPGGLGDKVRLSIRDTGVGVAPEMLSRLFEPFFTTKEVGKGTGLGLSQVYGFARASGGEAGVESVLGEGTTIWLRIPRSTKALAVEAVAAPPREAGPAGRRVLLVEDDDSVAQLVEEMLRELGYDVARAGDALKALEALRNDIAFDLVFSDMVMPGDLGGLDLARDISRLRPDLPVLLTTGYSAAAAAATNEGRRVLVKPYRIEALAVELDAMLTGVKRAS